MVRGVLPLILLFVGGGLGSLARHGVALLHSAIRPLQTAEDHASRFPFATLAVNVLGCMAIGFIAERIGSREMLRLALLTGLLGGFTTFSAFGLDAVRLLTAGRPAQAIVYVLITNAAGLAACYVAYAASGGGPPVGLETD